MTRSRVVPVTGRHTGSPSMATSTAVCWAKTNWGGSFCTGTARASCCAFSMSSSASSRSRDMVEGPPAIIVWKVCWYPAALSGVAGKVALLTVRSAKATVRDCLDTYVCAVISMTPKSGSLAPAGRTDTAAWAAMVWPSQLSSCGWYMVYVAPSCSIVLGHGSGVTAAAAGWSPPDWASAACCPSGWEGTVDAHPHTIPTAHNSTIILMRIASSFSEPGHPSVLTRTRHKGWDEEQREGWTLRATPGLTPTPLSLSQRERERRPGVQHTSYAS